MEHRFDLHLHSNCSDGTDAPERLMQRAFDAGLSLCALTDHDCIEGVSRAQAAGRTLGMTVISGIEFDTQFPSELHILGLGVDIENGTLRKAVNRARNWREQRNAAMLKKLRRAGYELSPYLSEKTYILTRYHMAGAMVGAGYAESIQDAFTRFLNPGCAAYEPGRRHTPGEVVGYIHAAGGVAALAHPCAIRGDVHAIVAELASQGLDGIEAYYPTSTPGQTELFTSLAAQYGLMVTCGSDYHGPGRPKNAIGSAWQDVRALEATYDFFLNRS